MARSRLNTLKEGHFRKCVYWISLGFSAVNPLKRLSRLAGISRIQARQEGLTDDVCTKIGADARPPFFIASRFVSVLLQPLVDVVKFRSLSRLLEDYFVDGFLFTSTFSL